MTIPFVMSPTSLPARARREAGFTLVEVLVASFVLVVGLLGVLSTVDAANKATSVTRGREGATSLGRELTEAAHAIPFDQLGPATVVPKLQAQPGLEPNPNPSPPGAYQMNRRGFTYTVTASVCSIDDGTDGYGSHTGLPFCTDSTQTGTADSDPQDYKRVVINLAWNGHTIRQTVVLQNPGDAGGPSITSLTVPGASPSPSAPVITDPNVSNVNLSAQTSTAPATITWSIDGAVQPTAPTGGPTSWSFTWNIKPLGATASTGATLDGIYSIGARTYDAYGNSGSPQELTVVLNRRVPYAPTGLVAGRLNDSSNQVVDIEWLSNPERDVIGYRVERQLPGGSPVQVCPAPAANPSFVAATSCQDTSPPDAPDVQYRVIAVDRDNSGNPRPGDPTAWYDVTQGNHPPTWAAGAPLTLTNSEGTVKLTWDPTQADAQDPGDQIQFFRIYRDGTAISNRYDRTGLGTDATWTDSSDGTTHQYWITAVDSQLGESAPIGPVTG